MLTMNDRSYPATLTLIAITLSLLLVGSGPAHSRPGSGNSAKPGQAVVKIGHGRTIAGVVGAVGATVLDSISKVHTYLIGFPEENPVEEVVNDLSSDPYVLYAASNTSVELPEVNQTSQAFPDQQEPAHTEGISPTAFYESPGVYQTGLDAAHTVTTGKGIAIAVIDNGLDQTHPLIACAKIKFGYDYVDDDHDPTEEPGALYGHGTFVTGLVLLGAPDCTIIPLRAFDESGIGDQFSVAQAIYRAIDRRADVINMSFGTRSPDIVLERAIMDATEAGLVLVSSSGNDGANQQVFPAAYLSVIAVTSFDTLEVLASFANYGDYIDLCAPGVNLYSALLGEYQWGTWSGTSFSAPLVSAAAGLVRAVHRRMTPTDIQGQLRFTARKELMWGPLQTPDLQYGYGALDAYFAVSTYAATAGDLDHDGQRDNVDLRILINHLEGDPGSLRSPSVRRLADINCDGNVDIQDVIAMSRHIANGWEGYQSCLD
jgi:subtilisin family serine protease